MSDVGTDILFVMPAAVASLIFLCTVASWMPFRKRNP